MTNTFLISEAQIRNYTDIEDNVDSALVKNGIREAQDIKLQPINGFRFKELLDKEYFVLHCPYIDKNCDVSVDIKLIKEGKPLKKHFNLFDSYKNYYFKYLFNKFTKNRI